MPGDRSGGKTHIPLARMTFEGHEIIFWPDIERFLEELYPLFPEEKEGLRAAGRRRWRSMRTSVEIKPSL
ncbi:MAG TPA: hypothetical protein VMT91_03520 [Anaerolineales bacterium]|nr:hypothetical protein [Anaerolineales bacterium]